LLLGERGVVGLSLNFFIGGKDILSEEDDFLVNTESITNRAINYLRDKETIFNMDTFLMLPNQLLGVATTAMLMGVVTGWALFSRNKKVVHIHHHYPVPSEEPDFVDSSEDCSKDSENYSEEHNFSGEYSNEGIVEGVEDGNTESRSIKHNIYYSPAYWDSVKRTEGDSEPNSVDTCNVKVGHQLLKRK